MNEGQDKIGPVERIKDIAKAILKSSPIPFSKNHLYDLQSRKIFSTRLDRTSNCIDVGCHKGEILDELLKAAPDGEHYGFEPIPVLFDNLMEKYNDLPNVHIHRKALSDRTGEATFNYVISNPSYSGLERRRYDRANEKDTQITVDVDLLDNIIPPEIRIDLIKIDVEGGELDVLRGATRILSDSQPIVIFEHGKGAADVYNCSPDQLYAFFDRFQMGVFNLGAFLKGHSPLSKAAFKTQYNKGLNYYFVASKVA